MTERVETMRLDPNRVPPVHCAVCRQDPRDNTPATRLIQGYLLCDAHSVLMETGTGLKTVIATVWAKGKPA